jgi:hypothetical protein
MPTVTITREKFLADRQGRTFADVLAEAERPFDLVLRFLSDEGRQRRMEEAELHHDRPPMAGIVRELEAQEPIEEFLKGLHARRTQRFRQAIGVLVRMIMEQRGWEKTGKKGSLGVRAEHAEGLPSYNAGGLSLWFVRAERYRLATGMPFRSVEERCEELEHEANRGAGTSVS